MKRQRKNVILNLSATRAVIFFIMHESIVFVPRWTLTSHQSLPRRRGQKHIDTYKKTQFHAYFISFRARNMLVIR